MGIGAKHGIFASTGVTAAASFANNNSLELDGTGDYLNCGAGMETLYAIDTYSISAWLRRSSGTNQQTIVCIKDPGSYHGNDFLIQHYEGITRLDVYINGASAFRNASVSLNDDQWYHLVVTVNKPASGYTNKCKAYLDGSLLTNDGGTNVQQLVDNNMNFTIGLQEKGTSSIVLTNAWNGYIDEVAVWTTELSASEVTDVYNSGTPADISSTSPANWWRMGDNDGGTGTTVTDQGSNGDDGTLAGDASFSTTVPT